MVCSSASFDVDVDTSFRNGKCGLCTYLPTYLPRLAILSFVSVSQNQTIMILSIENRRKRPKCLAVIWCSVVWRGVVSKVIQVIRYLLTLLLHGNSYCSGHSSVLVVLSPSQGAASDTMPHQTSIHPSIFIMRYMSTSCSNPASLLDIFRHPLPILRHRDTTTLLWAHAE